MKSKNKVSIFWFRRDLRLDDNVGLYQALTSRYPVLPVFIFDENILAQSEDKKDRRVDYIHQALSHLNIQLASSNARLNTFYGTPLDSFKMLAEKYAIQSVFYNRDYEPQAIERDKEVDQFFNDRNIPSNSYKDQVIFDRNDVVKKDGMAYTVYTPYSKKWKSLLATISQESNEPDCTNFVKQEFAEIISLPEIGFQKTDIVFKKPELDATVITMYNKFRDFPSMQGTTQLGIALRFGTISIRKCVTFASIHNQTWLNELIWREFFMQILYHFPYVVNYSFKTKYDNINWRNDEQEFQRWCEGKTGYPIVDAGMRQLNETGYMHNRARMIAASFLCKQLLIDWRWGEAYFAQKLNDYDLSANNGNWQWASGSGCDAAPYFRVFNPLIQAKKFDKNLTYVKRWLPEYEMDVYPKPIVELTFARERALKFYGQAVQENN